jgi:hypothetical protein
MGKLAMHTLALAAIRAGLLDEPRQYPAPRKVNACNLSPEEIAERDRPMSRQQRRQMERLAKKGRTRPTVKE